MIIHRASPHSGLATTVDLPWTSLFVISSKLLFHRVPPLSRQVTSLSHQVTSHRDLATAIDYPSNCQISLDMFKLYLAWARPLGPRDNTKAFLSMADYSQLYERFPIGYAG